MWRQSFSLIMVQIKLFKAKTPIYKVKTPHMEMFESTVNEFLKENEDKIIVRDIKYTSEILDPNNSAGDIFWTVMIIYDLKPE